jgi:CTP:molybdopterin cytidylyltransferase MocA
MIERAPADCIAVSTAHVEALQDIDTPADLVALRDALRGQRSTQK